MRTIGLGIQEFEKIRKQGLFYVDKTAFLSEWYKKSDDITLITRPRRFGKTLTIDMLHCFFSTSYAGRGDLFAGLAVSRDAQLMALQGTVPTVKISFAGLKSSSFRGFLTGLAGRIALLLGRFRYLTESNILAEDEKELLREMSLIVPKIPEAEDREEYEKYIFKLTHTLHFLSIWLSRFHGQRVFIFLDEYDTPLQTAYMYRYYDDAIAVMRELFSETFKENEVLGRAVITGITRIAKESLFSDMNNLAVSSVMSGGYDRAFGFTEEEMEAALAEYEVSEQKELVRFWYYGFTIGYEKGLYNPWSVTSFLSRKQYPPEDYWAKSGGVGLIDYLLRRGGTGLREGFETLLRGGTIERRIREDLIFPNLDRDENAVWSLLIAAGYVKQVANAPTEAFRLSMECISRPKTRLMLTNYESLLALSELVSGWFASESGNYMENFAEALLAQDLSEMNRQMQQAVFSCVSNFDSAKKPSEGKTAPENFFHALTLGMLTCLSDTHHVVSNRESGFGRFDVSVWPRDFRKYQDAFLMEFKVFSEREGDKNLEDTAMRARRQIEEKRYDAALLDIGVPTERIRKYGFGFQGKQVLIVE